MNFHLVILLIAFTFYQNFCESAQETACIFGPPQTSTSQQSNSGPVFVPQLKQSIEPATRTYGRTVPPYGPHTTTSVTPAPPSESVNPLFNNRASPLWPVYDRTGFRREPLHPSYKPSTKTQFNFPTTVSTTITTPDSRTSFDSWSFNSGRNDSKGAQVPFWSRFQPSRTPGKGISRGASRGSKGVTGATPAFYRPTREPSSKRPIFVSPLPTETLMPSRPVFGFSRRELSNAPADPRSGASGPNQQHLTAYRFVRWLQKSGFMDVLNSTQSNYTLILPTDKAVNKLPLKYQQSLDENKKQLEALLMYHIVPGSVNISRLRDEDTVPTVSGRDIRFNRYEVERENAREMLLTMSGAPIVAESGMNGGRMRFVVVDRVMYPPQGNLYEIISKSPILRSLTNLVNAANLQTELSVSGPFTLFAPSDDAFNKLSSDSIAYLSHDAESSRGMYHHHMMMFDLLKYE